MGYAVGAFCTDCFAGVMQVMEITLRSVSAMGGGRKTK